MPEICICAAIRFHDVSDGGNNREVILRGQRHFDCFDAARKRGWTRLTMGALEQGFMTSENRFVNRREGFQLQTAAGIPSVEVEGYHSDVLFSEDLY